MQAGNEDLIDKHLRQDGHGQAGQHQEEPRQHAIGQGPASAPQPCAQGVQGTRRLPARGKIGAWCHHQHNAREGLAELFP